MINLLFIISTCALILKGTQASWKTRRFNARRKCTNWGSTPFPCRLEKCQGWLLTSPPPPCHHFPSPVLLARIKLVSAVAGYPAVMQSALAPSYSNSSSNFLLSSFLLGLCRKNPGRRVRLFCFASFLAPFFSSLLVPKKKDPDHPHCASELSHSLLEDPFFWRDLFL